MPDVKSQCHRDNIANSAYLASVTPRFADSHSSSHPVSFIGILFLCPLRDTVSPNGLSLASRSSYCTYSVCVLNPALTPACVGWEWVPCLHLQPGLSPELPVSAHSLCPLLLSFPTSSSALSWTTAVSLILSLSPSSQIRSTQAAKCKLNHTSHSPQFESPTPNQHLWRTASPL